ncbi:MAG TPA: MFS transporter [Caulobacteraceae bacterium]|nr:MFS transporter [Caulobacteraceae bacterium]
MSSSSAGAAEKPYPLPGLVAFGTVGVPLAGMLLIFGLWAPRFYVTRGLPLAVVGFAILIVRLLDICLDPVIALAMDRTRTPIGRYRPWMILAVPFLVYGVSRVLLPGPHPTPGYLILWMVFTYVGYSMLTLGQTAWSATLAPTYQERSRLFGWTQGMAVIGSVALLVLPAVTHGAIVPGRAKDMPTMAMFALIGFPLAVLIAATFTRERPAPPAVKQKFSMGDYVFAGKRMWRVVLADLVLTLGPGTTGPIYVYFFHYAKGFRDADVGFLLIFYIGAGILGAPFWGHVARRVGKHRTVQIACVCYGVTQTILMALPHVNPGYHLAPDGVPTAVGMFAVGFCASAFILLIRAMVADIVDEVKLETRRDLTSLMFSMVTTTTKIGQAVTVSIVFPILAMVGFNGKEDAANTPQAIFGLEMCYLFAPIILVFFGGAMLFGYTLDAKRHAEIRAALAATDPAASEESLIGPTTEPPEPVPAE